MVVWGWFGVYDLTGDYTVYIDKLFEAEGSSGTPNTDLEAKLYIGDYAVYDLTLTNNADGPARAELNYLHRDRLGSVVAMSNSQGAVINMTGRGFDAFGKPREEGWQDSNHMNGADDNSGAGEPGDLNRNDLSTRGFTGHEHLNETDLIHMNGRVYDYNLGRFLSVDPFIQFPANSQSMNAYSYLMNNPLSGTDPSGYQSNGDSEIRPTGESSGGSSAMGQVLRDTSGFHGNLQGFSLNWRSIQVAPVNGVSAGGSSGDDMMSAEDKMTQATRSNQGNDDSVSDDNSGNSGGNEDYADLDRSPSVNGSGSSAKSSKAKGLYPAYSADPLNRLAYDLVEKLNPVSYRKNSEIGVIIGVDSSGNYISGNPFKGHNGKLVVADIQIVI